jgi:ABC-2 type transport system ATP-binding protein
MEDIRSLCSRCVVINSGNKIYDGDLASLLEKHQNYKKITVLFENEADIILPENTEVIEKNGDKICFTVIKSEAQAVLRSLINRYDITDISVEEEDIGNVIERIYQSGNRVTVSE